MFDNILVLSTAGATIAKVLVDIFKMAFPCAPRWIPPMLALVSGIVCVLLVVLSVDEAIITRAIIARSILGGIMAGGLAIGVTELHTAARREM